MTEPNEKPEPIIESLSEEPTKLSAISDGDLLLGIGQGNEPMYYEYMARKLKQRLSQD